MLKIVKLVLIMSAWLVTPGMTAEQSTHSVSLVELLAVPEKYADKNVRVKGFYNGEFYGAIFINHISADIMDEDSSIPVIDQTEAGELALGCKNGYVEVIGHFAFDGYEYKISDVKKVMDVKSLKVCWEKN